MLYVSVNRVHFSATGTTKKIIETIDHEFSGTKAEYDLCNKPLTRDIPLAADSLLLVGMPVYAGRIPALCVESLRHLKGNGTPAIVVVVYGNRDYDDALLELKNTMESSGFVVIAAAAFIAQHSIFPAVGAQRPDAADLTKITYFAHHCLQKLQDLPAITATPLLKVKGNMPYKEAAAVALKPSADDTCTQCGTCVDACPTHALALSDEKLVKNDALCISCAACVAQCPTHSQAFRGPQYEAFSKMFTEKNAQRKEPEIFI